MRQTHVGGDKLLVHYAGDRVPVIVDGLTGETRQAQIFVAVLAPPTSPTRKRPGPMESAPTLVHLRWSAAYRGCWCPTTPRSLSSRPASTSRRSIEPMRRWRRITAPPCCRRDKAKVDVAVLVVERWILTRLRHRQFHSLAELNAAIAELLKRLNEEKPLRRLGRTRRQLLEQLDRPALKPLPIDPYVFAQWRVCRVGIDYHAEVEKHLYSVPYRFARAEVEVRLTSGTVEIFIEGERIAAHSARKRQRQAHHHDRSHAVQSSPLRRLDQRPHPPGCDPHRRRLHFAT